MRLHDRGGTLFLNGWRRWGAVDRTARGLTAAVLGVGAIVLCAGGADAQTPQVTAIWPPGGVLGGNVSAQIEGTALAGSASVAISGEGVKATLGAPAADGTRVPLALQIAADALPGPREVRLLAPAGLSTPGYLWIGALPERAEKEPDNRFDQAMALERTPETIDARIDAAEDVDWYTFRAEAGETWVFDVVAYRLYSPLDPFLELHDAENRLLTTATEGYDRDPRLVYTFRKTGIYYLQIRDTLYRGGPGFVYRLNAGRLPVIQHLDPPGGRRGQRLTAAIDGVNLGTTREWSVDLPANAPMEQPWYVLPRVAGGVALPVAVVADDRPQARKTGACPATRPQAVTLPVTINGGLSSRKEEDHYRFVARKGTALTIRLFARGIGSRLHALLRLYGPDGKEVMNSEEQIGRDPRLDFTPPADGDYRIAVSGIDPEAGPDYYYRLSLGDPDSDYRLTVSPEALAPGRGQTVTLTVSAERLGGYDGPIEVRSEDLPAGLAGTMLTLNRGQSQGILTVTAPTDGAVSVGLFRVRGVAMVGSRRIEHLALPVATLPRPGEGQPAPRPVAFMGAASTAAVPLFALALEPARIELMRGATATVKVRAARKPGDSAATAAIGLETQYVPTGVTLETPPIAANQAEGTIKLSAAQTAAPGTYSVLLVGKIGETAFPAPALIVVVR